MDETTEIVFALIVWGLFSCVTFKIGGDFSRKEQEINLGSTAKLVSYALIFAFVCAAWATGIVGLDSIIRPSLGWFVCISSFLLGAIVVRNRNRDDNETGTDH